MIYKKLKFAFLLNISNIFGMYVDNNTEIITNVTIANKNNINVLPEDNTLPNKLKFKLSKYFIKFWEEKKIIFLKKKC